MTQEPSRPAAYRLTGALYILLGLPAFWALLSGALDRGGNPYFALSLMGVPLGLLLWSFVWPGNRQSNLSDIGLRVAAAGLVNVVFMLWSRIIMDRYHPGFETAFRFFGVLVSFLGTASLIVLLASLIRRR